MMNRIEEFTKFAISIAQEFIVMDGEINQMEISPLSGGQDYTAYALYDSLNSCTIKQLSDGTVRIRKDYRPLGTEGESKNE